MRGKFEFYAAHSGLASGTLQDHMKAYFAQAATLPAGTDIDSLMRAAYAADTSGGDGMAYYLQEAQTNSWPLTQGTRTDLEQQYYLLVTDPAPAPTISFAIAGDPAPSSATINVGDTVTLTATTSLNPVSAPTVEANQSGTWFSVAPMAPTDGTRLTWTVTANGLYYWSAQDYLEDWQYRAAVDVNGVLTYSPAYAVHGV